MYLSDRESKIKASKTMDVVGKLFSLWLEMEYFESNLKESFNHNSGYIGILIDKLQNPLRPGVIDL